MVKVLCGLIILPAQKAWRWLQPSRFLRNMSCPPFLIWNGQHLCVTGVALGPWKGDLGWPVLELTPIPSSLTPSRKSRSFICLSSIYSEGLCGTLGKAWANLGFSDVSIRMRAWRRGCSGLACAEQMGNFRTVCSACLSEGQTSGTKVILLCLREGILQLFLLMEEAWLESTHDTPRSGLFLPPPHTDNCQGMWSRPFVGVCEPFIAV